MTTHTEILAKLKELKPTLSKDYSIKEIGLFGSFSADTSTHESDIDILPCLQSWESSNTIPLNF